MKCTLTLTAPDGDALDAAMIKSLRERGYYVLKIEDKIWETPKAFCKRIGITVKTFSTKTRLIRCPVFEFAYGESGRINILVANRKLETFLTEHKR